MTIPDPPPQLPNVVLDLRTTLPLKPEPVVLKGRWVRLEPIQPHRDAAPLFAVTNGDPIQLGDRKVDAYDAEKQVWRYMFSGPYDSVEQLRTDLVAAQHATNGLCLCVFDIASGQQVGVTNFMSNSLAHLKIELGGIWYSPVVQRTATNTEATYLMLRHLFDLGYRRAEWKCHAQNLRSRKAALRMGFKFEGIQERHMIVKNRPRDTAWFRILVDEWPDVKARLEAMLYG